ncbi:hypothetical protein ACFQXB_18125 [Plastorhodobacter daqingensis]|uniref:GIY-YIG domain-containing protein n=1 Tax=Plastorhodobacter daqingensis TaxID=1387281 RepID=A0ABW2USB6_9RHOB
MPFKRVIELEAAQAAIANDVAALLSQPCVPMGAAKPPSSTGVYILTIGDDVMYVGEAKGKKGLKDRLTAKHISGDDSHAIQRAFKMEFPDRSVRREHIKKTVFARWLEISPDHRVSAVERTLIWMFDPPWNVK